MRRFPVARLLPSAVVLCLSVGAFGPSNVVRASELRAIAHDTLPEVFRQGAGARTLLLIGCMSCRWRSWDTFMARNSERFDMIAVTPPGFGGTPVPPTPRDTAGAPWREALLRGLSDLMRQEDLRDVTVVGHSFGAMVAVQLAAREKERISRIVSIDGALVSTGLKQTRAERLAEAERVVRDLGAKLSDAETWRRWNRGGDTMDGRADIMPCHRAILYHGMFMATSRTVLLQYWRENELIELTPILRELSIPILDLKPIRGENQAAQKEQHLATLRGAGLPPNHTTVFLHDTSHFAMEHRPELLDRIIAEFIAGRELQDFKP